MIAPHPIPAAARAPKRLVPLSVFVTLVPGLLALILLACVQEPPGAYGNAALLPPTVISTAPAHLDTGVALDAVVTATFSEPMHPDSLNERTFILLRPTLGGGFDTVSGTVTYDLGTRTAAFTPDDSLLPGTLYKAVITIGAVDAACNPPAVPFEWNFTTVTPPCVDDPFDPPPALTRTAPADLEGDVDPNAVITATFNEPMDPASLNEATFIVVRLTGLGPDTIDGSVSYSAGDTTAVFTPDDPLLPGQTYRAYLTIGMQDAQCSPLYKTFAWTFTVATPPPPACVNDPFDAAPTVTRTDPVNLDGDVAPDAVITATFSEPMDPATINTETFVVVRLTAFGPDTIEGTVTYSAGDTTAIFTPDEDMLPGHPYRAYLTIGTQDAQCTPLTTTFVWNFTIDTPPPPPSCVDDPFDAIPNDIRRSPAILEDSVPLGSIIVVTFNEPMDPSSLNNLTFFLFHYHDGLTDTLPGTVTVLPGDTVAIFDPLSDLLPGAFYQAVITTVARDAQCSPLDTPVYIPFTTTLPPPTVNPVPENFHAVPNVVFNWTATPQAYSYHLQIATDAAFTNLVQNLTNLSGASTSRTVSGLVAVTTYYWRMSVTNPAGTSGWTPTYSFMKM